MRVRVEHIRLSPNVPAGMNVLVLMSLVHMLRATTKDPAPVLLRRDGKTRLGGKAQLYTVTDGRHRVLVLAEIEGEH